MSWIKITLLSILIFMLVMLIFTNFIQLLKYKVRLKSKKLIFKSQINKLNTIILIFFIVLILPSLTLPILYSKYYVFPGVYSILGFVVISFWIPIRLYICKEGIGIGNIYGRFLTFVPWNNLSSYKLSGDKKNKLSIKTKVNKKISNTSFDIKLNDYDKSKVTKILTLVNAPIS